MKTIQQSNDPRDVALEFTRGDQVEMRFLIPWQGWEAFKSIAAANSKSPESYLMLLLQIGLDEGESLGQQIYWLFGANESDEIRRFRQAQAMFHAEDTQ